MIRVPLRDRLADWPCVERDYRSQAIAAARERPCGTRTDGFVLAAQPSQPRPWSQPAAEPGLPEPPDNAGLSTVTLNRLTPGIRFGRVSRAGDLRLVSASTARSKVADVSGPLTNEWHDSLASRGIPTDKCCDQGGVRVSAPLGAGGPSPAATSSVNAPVSRRSGFSGLLIRGRRRPRQQYGWYPAEGER